MAVGSAYSEITHAPPSLGGKKGEAVLHIAQDTQINAICNGKRSAAPASWWIQRIGAKANQLHTQCTKRNVIIDAHSGETLIIKECEPQTMVEIETSYSPKIGMRLTFCAPIGAKLRLYFGGEITVANHGALNGAQLLGENAMLCVVAARTVTRRAYLCNTTALSGALLVHPATSKFIRTQYVERDLSIVKRYSPQKGNRYEEPSDD